MEEHFRSLIAELRQRIYGPNQFHLADFSEAKAQLDAFDPAKSAGSITLSYIGGMDGSIGGSDLHLQLRADGSLSSDNHGRRRLITTIPPERCAAVFRRVLTSGLLNYSEGIIELKKDLLPPDGWKMVTDNPSTEIHVFVPELKTEQTVSVYAPDVELKNFPDIIEFQIITQLEKEILELVPKDYPLWK